ncbi:NAD(P)-binding protein [Polychaeton citri CBS 116435]|uniref:NAD(P)-binding protein n=1 Tax=Polychaeton citri CBS 116435 TaxID=1314669 RepID=A0A9P4Q2N5_9PEZI|nr:NAD(P)-binding protein [Polychaeton citri CBS 116435]
MAAKKSIVLITGANSGIGFELARQLLSDASKHVLLGSRSKDKGETALKTLQSQSHPGSIELLQLDVANEDSIKAAAESVEGNHGRLDALVNNAGIAVPPGSIKEQMMTCFETNAVGPLLMVEHFKPLMQKSVATPRIINVSSGVGIISRRLDKNSPSYNLNHPQYRASKVALNMITACQIWELGEQNFKIFAYCPGFTESNLSDGNKTENGAKPVSEGTTPLVRMLNGERDAEHGRFLTGDGQYEW